MLCRPHNSPAFSLDRPEKFSNVLIAKARKQYFLVTRIVIFQLNSLISPLTIIQKHLTLLYGLFSLNQSVNEPARVTVSSSFITDHIAANYANKMKKCGVHKIYSSAHFMVHCIRTLNGALESNEILKTRKIKRFKELAFIYDVASKCWDQMITETDDFNAFVNHWTCIFSPIIGKHASIVK